MKSIHYTAFAIVSFIAFAALPFYVTADHVPGHTEESPTSEQYQFQRSGIFGCNQTAAYRMSVGALSAVGGVYVPVNDAAVTLNTGYLVYKECVLDGVSKRIAESAATGLVTKGLTDSLTGRDGKPRWPEDLIADILERSDQSRMHTIESGELSVLHPAFSKEVIRANLRDYMRETRAPNQALVCPYSGDLKSVLDGTTDDVFGGLMALTNPACNPLGAAYLARDYTEKKDALAVEEMMFRLTTGQGLYGIEEYNPATGRYTTRTPSSIVSANVQQLVTSGFRHLENVTEIDQMVGALFSSLSTRIISDSGGLAGLIQPTAGQPSYLEQMARESARGLRDSAINAALQILSGARQVEVIYLNAMKAIATRLTEAIGRVRGAEKQCWDLIIPKVQEYAKCPGQTTDPITDVTTCLPGFAIQVATSTIHSQQVIDSQIAPIAEAAILNIQASEQALELINRLIAGIANTTSLEAQRLALQQLDSLIAQNKLHNQYDAQQAEQRKGEVDGAMTQLTEDTVVAWADSTDPNIGWCNVNNPSVIQMWAELWRI